MGESYDADKRRSMAENTLGRSAYPCALCVKKLLNAENAEIRRAPQRKGYLVTPKPMHWRRDPHWRLVQPGPEKFQSRGRHGSQGLWPSNLLARGE